MKQNKNTTHTETQTTASDVGRWVQTLFRLHERLAPRFVRPEPHRRTLKYLQGLLSETSRKNGWQLAEHAGEARPDGMQRLLSSAVWDTDGVRDDLRCYALEVLGQENATLVIDESCFPKRGKKSAGVGLQYCGTSGRVENCQVGVFLSYVTAKGHTLIDRELYLPLDWCEDRERCRAAGIPEAVRFQTKPELARRMVERIGHTQIPVSWVVADTVYGGNLDLRLWLEAHGYPYRDELFPTTTFRLAYDSLRADGAKRADRDYVRILHLAASTSETDVETALQIVLEAGNPPTFLTIRDLVHVPTACQIPPIQAPVLDLSSYDQLIPESEDPCLNRSIATTNCKRCSNVSSSVQWQPTLPIWHSKPPKKGFHTKPIST